MPFIPRDLAPIVPSRDNAPKPDPAGSFRAEEAGGMAQEAALQYTTHETEYWVADLVAELSVMPED
jgi:hypothetical protein